MALNRKPTPLRALALSLMVAATPLAAQDLSDKIMDDTQRAADRAADQASVRQTGPGVIADPPTRRDLPAPGGPTVLLSAVSFAPASAFLTQGELDAIAAKYIGKRLDFAGLSALVRDVNDLYAAKGVVTASAILGPQDLGQGALTVTLVEGQVGLVSIVGDRLTKSEFITGRIRFAKGTTVDVPTAAKDIAWFNQTNAAQLRLLLQPGAGFGQTDLAFGVTEPKPVHSEFALDTNGIEATGALQGSYLYRRYGLLGRDDTALVYLSGSEGSRSATLRYDVSITPSGTRLALTTAASDYRVIDGPTLPLKLTGNSVSSQLVLTQPLVATERFALSATFGYARESTESRSAGVLLVNSQTSKRAPGLSFGLTGDRWALNADVQMVSASVDDFVARGTKTYRIGVGSLDGSYQIADDLRLVGRGAWQATKAKLIPGNLLFSIGGPSSVRGYPAEGVAGDSGYFANLELHKTLSMGERSVDGFVFVDFGAVYSTFPKVTRMASAGVGMTYPMGDKLALDLSMAFPLRDAVSTQDDMQLSATVRLANF